MFHRLLCTELLFKSYCYNGSSFPINKYYLEYYKMMMISLFFYYYYFNDSHVHIKLKCKKGLSQGKKLYWGLAFIL